MDDQTTPVVIVAAPAGATRQRLESFLRQRGVEVRSLQRERVVPDGGLLLEGDQLLWRGQELLRGATAALVLDSGYMWPLPLLDPTEQQWAAGDGRLDDFLRDDRETASLWYSLLAVVEQRVGLCVNPAAAFAFEALKPDALEALRAGGLAVAPAITTNDPAALEQFVAQHPGLALRELSLVPRAAPRWLEPTALKALPLQQQPVMLVAAARAEVLRLHAVGGAAVPAPDLPAELLDQVPGVAEALGAGWATLDFSPLPDGGWGLCDFSAAPDLGALDHDAAQQVLRAVWRLLETAPA